MGNSSRVAGVLEMRKMNVKDELEEKRKVNEESDTYL